jgi:hypothetical protein
VGWFDDPVAQPPNLAVNIRKPFARFRLTEEAFVLSYPGLDARIDEVTTRLIKGGVLFSSIYREYFFTALFGKRSLGCRFGPIGHSIPAFSAISLHLTMSNYILRRALR